MSKDRNTFLRSLHDLGAAAWFGGGLMGAIALNGAANDVSDPTERAAVASSGWARWAPVNSAAIAAHLIGSAGLLLSNRKRVAAQSGAGANSVAKTILTGAALGTTAYSGYLGLQVGKAGHVPAEGGTVPSPATPDAAASAQQQLRVLQWVTPALTAGLVILGAQQGEQQKPRQLAKGLAKRAFTR